MPDAPPRLNHVALSLPPAALEPEGRAEIVEFYGDVFGWREYPQLTRDGQLLVLGLATYDQFVYLLSDDDPLRAPRTDHFGLSVATRAEFDALLTKVKQKQAGDPRIDLDDHTVDDQEVVKIHSFYVHHLLPLTVEVQWWEFPSAP
ncbi:MAG TPA: hypothetical protein VHA73_09095 [Acidimicrobiales bacterium]|jgi:hypothetical protein|nr:hypothetical protein [Acidimicrobiales bacterium]